MEPTVVENPSFIQVVRCTEAVLLRCWSNRRPTLEFWDGDVLVEEPVLIWPGTGNYDLDMEHLKGQIAKADFEVQYIFVIPDEVQTEVQAPTKGTSWTG